MKKFGIFALVAVLALSLCACTMGSSDPADTNATTLPTVIPMPSTGDNFRPDDDGFIGETETTETTQATVPRSRDRMRLR